MTGLLDKFRASINAQNKLKLNKQVIILLILFCLFIAYADFSFVIKPQLNGIMTVSQKIIKLKKDLDDLSKDLSLMGDSKKGVIKNKVKIMQINTLLDEEDKEETIAGGKFLPIMIKLNLSCNYHSLGGFINTLENMETFMSLDEMKISRDPKDYLQQKVGLVLKTYAKK